MQHLLFKTGIVFMGPFTAIFYVLGLVLLAFILLREEMAYADYERKNKINFLFSVSINALIASILVWGTMIQLGRMIDSFFEMKDIIVLHIDKYSLFGIRFLVVVFMILYINPKIPDEPTGGSLVGS